MYPIYKRILSEHIISGTRKFISLNSLEIEYYGEIPCFKPERFLYAIDSSSCECVYRLIIKMLKVFGIEKCWNNRLHLDMRMVRNYWLGINGKWRVWMLSDFPLYDNSDGKLDRLLLFLLIDPLAFISKMRLKINESSLIVRSFFNKVETSINDILHEQNMKYFLMKQLENGMVSDITFLVVIKWIYLEVHDLEKLKE